MKVYTIHSQDFGPDAVPDLQVVKEGFNWAAFLFVGFWAVFKGYWWVALGFFVISLGSGVMISLLDGGSYAQMSVNGVLAIVMGTFGNDLGRWTLKRRGYVEKDVIVAGDAQYALSRFVNEMK